MSIITSVNLDIIGFDEIETQAYIDDFEKEHFNKNNIVLSLDKNHLILHEHYNFKNFMLKNNKYYAYDLTYYEFEKHGFLCN